MGCYICKRKAAYSQQKGREICNECFCKLIEKRVRKYARINKLFRKEDRILVIGDVNKYLVESIVKDLPVKLFFRAKEDKNFAKKNKINKIFIEYTLDDEVNDFLNSVFKGKKEKKLDKKHIRLLRVATDEEVELFAKIKKLRFKPNKKDPFVKMLIDKLHKEHPSAKYTLLKNIRELKGLI